MQKLRWTCFWTNVNELMKYWRQCLKFTASGKILVDKYKTTICFLSRTDVFCTHKSTHPLKRCSDKESRDEGKERDNDSAKDSTDFTHSPLLHPPSFHLSHFTLISSFCIVSLSSSPSRSPFFTSHSISLLFSVALFFLFFSYRVWEVLRPSLNVLQSLRVCACPDVLCVRCIVH